MPHMLGAFFFLNLVDVNQSRYLRSLRVKQIFLEEDDGSAGSKMTRTSASTSGKLILAAQEIVDDCAAPPGATRLAAGP